VLCPETPNVHLPEVQLGLAADNPAGHLFADPTGPGDPVGAKAGSDEETADLALAQDELVVRGEGFRTVDHPVDPGIGNRWHALDGAVHDLGEARPVRREELAVE